VIMAFGVVPPLGREIQAVGGALLLARGHDLDAREPCVTHQWLTAADCLQRGCVEQCRQLAANAFRPVPPAFRLCCKGAKADIFSSLIRRPYLKTRSPSISETADASAKLMKYRS